MVETSQIIEVGLPARDRLRLSFKVKDGEILDAKLEAVGCMELLRLVEVWRPHFQGSLEKMPLPEGRGHAAILMRELVLKTQGRWKFPYADEELCHCRAVPTAKVDAAIVGGCHSLEAVRAATSASTSCGTCRPDVENVLAYRLKSD